MSSPISAPNADSSRNVTRYLGQNYQFVPGYLRTRDPTTADIRDPKNQGYYPFPALWINKSNQNLWALVRIANNLGTWILLSSGGHGTVISLSDTVGTKTFADVAGNIQLKSSDASISIIAGTNNLDLILPGGGQAIQKVNVDAATAPGTNPVIPSSGAITIEGGATFANSGTRTQPIRTNSLAANTIDLEIQFASSNAGSSDTHKYGVAQFDSNQFTVTSGFVQITNFTPFSYVQKSANYNVALTDNYISTDSSGGVFTLTLPASPTTFHIYIIKDRTGSSSTNNVTISGNGKNIDGAASYKLMSNFSSVQLLYNGTSWEVF